MPVPQKRRRRTLCRVCVCVLLFFPTAEHLHTFSRCELFLILLDFDVLCSDSQLAGYLLHHFQPGYGAARKHVEIRDQVGAETLKHRLFSGHVNGGFQLLFKSRVLQPDHSDRV